MKMPGSCPLTMMPGPRQPTRTPRRYSGTSTDGTTAPGAAARAHGTPLLCGMRRNKIQAMAIGANMPRRGARLVIQISLEGGVPGVDIAQLFQRRVDDSGIALAVLEQYYRRPCPLSVVAICPRSDNDGSAPRPVRGGAVKELRTTQSQQIQFHRHRASRSSSIAMGPCSRGSWRWARRRVPIGPWPSCRRRMLLATQDIPTFACTLLVA